MQVDSDYYKMTGAGSPKTGFSFNYGKGMLYFTEPGTVDVHLKTVVEFITVGKPVLQARNFIIGGLYIDIDGYLEAKNWKTGDRCTNVLRFSHFTHM